jgi:hypothetical protein
MLYKSPITQILYELLTNILASSNFESLQAYSTEVIHSWYKNTHTLSLPKLLVTN